MKRPLPTFQELTEEIPKSDLLPPLDRVHLDCVDDLGLHQYQKQWVKEGVVHLKSFIPESLMDRYSALRERLKKPGGWSCPVPYMFYDEIKDISLHSGLMEVLRNLFGENMGLHLNLTGWISTEREWHQDDYLNPDYLLAHYAAVWIALEDVNPDSGPFEYVPGSHHWPLLRRDKVAAHLELGATATADWPSRAEKFVTPACIAEIERRQAQVVPFLGKRGDVLIWHGRLLHQGSKPKIPGTPRRALICHYSALSKRKDMPNSMRYTKPLVDGHYFVHQANLPQDERL